MSVATSRTDATTDLTSKQRRILEYLRQHATERTYFKSRLIGEELGLSAKEVGTNMPAVADATTDLEVQKWGYSSATTWRVTT
ncbi:MAG: DUF7123 family protein [archaeon]